MWVIVDQTTSDDSYMDDIWVNYVGQNFCHDPYTVLQTIHGSILRFEERRKVVILEQGTVILTIWIYRNLALY